MKSIWKREMLGYFYTPLGYIYLIVFVLSATFIFCCQPISAFIGYVGILCHAQHIMDAADPFAGHAAHCR